MTNKINNTEKWIKIAEWRGYTLKALEDIDDELKNIHVEMVELRKQNSKRDIRVAGIAGGISTLVVVIGWLIPYTLLR